MKAEEPAANIASPVPLRGDMPPFDEMMEEFARQAEEETPAAREAREAREREAEAMRAMYKRLSEIKPEEYDMPAMEPMAELEMVEAEADGTGKKIGIGMGILAAGALLAGGIAWLVKKVKAKAAEAKKSATSAKSQEEAMIALEKVREAQQIQMMAMDLLAKADANALSPEERALLEELGVEKQVEDAFSPKRSGRKRKSEEEKLAELMPLPLPRKTQRRKLSKPKPKPKAKKPKAKVKKPKSRTPKRKRRTPKVKFDELEALAMDKRPRLPQFPFPRYSYPTAPSAPPCAPPPAPAPAPCAENITVIQKT